MQLDEISNQINELTVGQPANKNKFCEHIEKVIRELEKHRQYLLEQWQKAKEAGWLGIDESKEEQYQIYQLEQMAEGKTEKYREYLLEQWRNGKKGREGKPIPKPYPWTWILDYSEISKHTYFTEDERWNKKELSVQFYIKGKPEPNPLSPLECMIAPCIGEGYKGLELSDYQFTLLAIIHDAQNWLMGRERICFSYVPHTQATTLADRFCKAVWEHLERYQQNPYGFKDVQDTIETALRAVKADLDSTKQNGNSNVTPKTDPSLIYQADASTFYNIPKSVLSKAAQKQSGEPGYLWSGRDGKRVFYKKADIEKINRSRTKLKS